MLDELREVFPGLPDGPVIIFADNQGAIHLSKDPKFHSRTKHLDIQWHFVREAVDSGAVDFVYVPTAAMAADGLTKLLDATKFKEFKRMIGLKSLKSIGV